MKAQNSKLLFEQITEVGFFPKETIVTLPRQFRHWRFCMASCASLLKQGTLRSYIDINFEVVDCRPEALDNKFVGTALSHVSLLAHAYVFEARVANNNPKLDVEIPECLE